MYDNTALNLSKQYIADQINYLYNCYTYIRQIVPIDSDGVNMRTDYLCGTDCIGIDDNANTYKIQLKTRQEGHNDVVLAATSLSGKAAEGNGGIGFWYKNAKYTFLVDADIYNERLGDGQMVNFRGTDIMGLGNWQCGRLCFLNKTKRNLCG